MALPGLISSLLDPGAYPHRCGPIHLTETHISWVLLTGDYAYKLKKPVDLGFLDFSTLARRRHFCHEELRCNRAFAPELYLAVVPIYSMDGNISVGTGDDEARRDRSEIVDYAVRMHQFPADEQLDRALDAGRLQGDELGGFAEVLWSVHERLPRARAGSRFGSADAVLAPVDENFRQLAAAPIAAEHAEALDELAAWSRRSHSALSPLLDRRQRQGFVRECHGDLHLSNLVRLPEGIRAFDCIEFSEALRWIDVVSDAAFLIMDCLVRGRRDLAYAFANRYFEASGDYEGARLLGFYLVYRSLVRAKVAALQHNGATNSDVRSALAARLAAHVRLATSRALQSRPLLVVTCGFSGSGKSWLAERLIPVLPALRIRSDVERKRLHGLTAEGRTSSGVGEGIYTAAQSERVYRHLSECASHIIAGGDCAVVDAAFLDRAQRQLFAALARRLAVPFVILLADCPAALLESRIVTREAHQGDPSEATLDVLRNQLQQGMDLRDDEPVLRVATAGTVDIEELARSLRAVAERV
jgi:uncharacterized protein